MTPRVLGVIPARLGSSRLPRKPLHRIAGRPLVEWVWRRVVETDLFDRVLVATDAPEIARAVEEFGGECVLTRSEHPSGTDRVAEVAARPELTGAEVVVNVQGDEPFVRRDHLAAAIALVEDGWEVGTVATPIGSVEEWRDPAAVKVVLGAGGRALLFSRSPIPFPRDAGEPGPEELAGGLYLRHLGVYAYRPDALRRWVALPEGELERVERLEQLRPLVDGISIGVAVVEAGEGGVDTPADAARAEARLLQERSAPDTISA